MNELQIFDNPKFGQVRTILRNREIWFVAKDVAGILGYAKTCRRLLRNTGIVCVGSTVAGVE